MPITHNDLYAQIIDFDNLFAAYLDARRGKRYRKEVARFAINLEENLLNLHNHLVWGSWQPGRAREWLPSLPIPSTARQPERSREC